MGSKFRDPGYENGKFVSPTGVAVDTSDNVYVADTGNNRIQKFDSNGNYITKWGCLYNGLGITPCSIAIDSLDNVYVCAAVTDHMICILKYDNISNGNVITQWTIPNDYGSMMDGGLLSVDSSGKNVYLATQSGPHMLIMKYTVNNGSVLPVFPGYTNPPTDPNHDDLYEDVNGNGILDFDDIVAYYDNMDWIEENANPALFDYNNNSLIDFDDIVKLYDML